MSRPPSIQQDIYGNYGILTALSGFSQLARIKTHIAIEGREQAVLGYANDPSHVFTHMFLAARLAGFAFREAHRAVNGAFGDADTQAFALPDDLNLIALAQDCWCGGRKHPAGSVRKQPAFGISDIVEEAACIAVDQTTNLHRCRRVSRNDGHAFGHQRRIIQKSAERFHHLVELDLALGDVT